MNANEVHASTTRYIRSYIVVGLALLGFNLVTAWAGTWKVSVPAAAVVLVIVFLSLRGSLKTVSFTQLRRERPYVLWLLLLTLVLLLAVLLLPMIMMLDSMAGNAG